MIEDELHWRERAEKAEALLGASITVGAGLSVYGSIEALGRVQDYILLDSTHPIEADDVRRSLAQALQASEARIRELEAEVVRLSRWAPGHSDLAVPPETIEMTSTDDKLIEALSRIAELEAENRELRAALRECADELLYLIEGRYGGGSSKKSRDLYSMEPVNRARRLLKETE